MRGEDVCGGGRRRWGGVGAGAGAGVGLVLDGKGTRRAIGWMEGGGGGGSHVTVVGVGVGVGLGMLKETSRRRCRRRRVFGWRGEGWDGMGLSRRLCDTMRRGEGCEQRSPSSERGGPFLCISLPFF